MDRAKKMRRQVAGIGTYLAILIVTLEVTPYLLSPLLMKEGFSRKEARAELDRIHAAARGEADTSLDLSSGYLSEHILHPYVGFVHGSGGDYNEFGFRAAIPLLKRSDSVINICVMGGSVAKQLVQFSVNTLKDRLADHPPFAGKKIQVVSVALGGFKQPQQLLALNYLLSLGAEYDMVINLDGFNEVVLPLSDNHPFNIYPSFPRHWNVYSRKSFPGRSLELMGMQAAERKARDDMATGMKGSAVRFSNLGLFVWMLRDRASEARTLALDKEMRELLAASGSDPQVNGPDYTFADTTGFLREQAGYWARCSRQMHALSGVSGFKYFHFLQPNQYVKGSKKLTPEELTTAYEAGEYIYKEAVERAYPMLAEEGRALGNDGVRFIDLTMLFVNEKATIYSDKCCHYNKRGYDLIASEIARSVIR